MKRGIFRRIFILYAVVLTVAVVFVEFYVASTVRQIYIETLRRNLAVQISLIAESISFAGPRLDDTCRRFKKDTGARVTVVAPDGRVVGDSDAESASMDNHLHRTEMEQAALFGAGMAVRHSDTLGYDFLYVARKIEDGSVRTGFIRLAVPLREVDASIKVLRLRIILVVIVVLLATGAFAVFQTDHLRRLLRQITGFSRSLSRGEIDKRLFLKNAGEFDEIAENLTAMSLRLQEMIARNEEEMSRLNVILRSVPDALLIIDVKGYVVLSSASARDFFGEIPESGAPFVDVVRNHTFAELVDGVRRSLSAGVAEVAIEVPAERVLSVRVSPLFYREGELAGFVAVFHDITQMKKLEEVRKDFVANVSHELKTPITAIRGFAETLLDGALDDRENAERFVQTIRANSERINSLVDDLMTISKIELGVITIEKATIDVESVHTAIFEIFRDRAAAKDLSLEWLNPRSIVTVQSDRNRLIQILTNLVDNAIKFTEKGGVSVGIDAENGRTVLFVEDTGIGVAPKYLGRLGERFFRVDPARSRTMGGTGLGLAIVKHLVRAHGWSMRFESTPGKGTRVNILL